ncbi:hypothetical protein KKC59_00325, partial [bacterium]|nr:hypothetical protein [bacterium]
DQIKGNVDDRNIAQEEDQKILRRLAGILKIDDLHYPANDLDYAELRGQIKNKLGDITKFLLRKDWELRTLAWAFGIKKADFPKRLIYEQVRDDLAGTLTKEKVQGIGVTDKKNKKLLEELAKVIDGVEIDNYRHEVTKEQLSAAIGVVDNTREIEDLRKIATGLEIVNVVEAVAGVDAVEAKDAVKVEDATAEQLVAVIKIDTRNLDELKQIATALGITEVKIKRALTFDEQKKENTKAAIIVLRKKLEVEAVKDSALLKYVKIEDPDAVSTHILIPTAIQKLLNADLDNQDQQALDSLYKLAKAVRVEVVRMREALKSKPAEIVEVKPAVVTGTEDERKLQAMKDALIEYAKNLEVVKKPIFKDVRIDDKKISVVIDDLDKDKINAKTSLADLNLLKTLAGNIIGIVNNIIKNKSRVNAIPEVKIEEAKVDPAKEVQALKDAIVSLGNKLKVVKGDKLFADVMVQGLDGKYKNIDAIIVILASLPEATPENKDQLDKLWKLANTVRDAINNVVKNKAEDLEIIPGATNKDFTGCFDPSLFEIKFDGLQLVVSDEKNVSVIAPEGVRVEQGVVDTMKQDAEKFAEVGVLFKERTVCVGDKAHTMGFYINYNVEQKLDAFLSELGDKLPAKGSTYFQISLFDSSDDAQAFRRFVMAKEFIRGNLDRAKVVKSDEDVLRLAVLTYAKVNEDAYLSKLKASYKYFMEKNILAKTFDPAAGKERVEKYKLFTEKFGEDLKDKSTGYVSLEKDLSAWFKIYEEALNGEKVEGILFDEDGLPVIPDGLIKDGKAIDLNNADLRHDILGNAA